MSNAAGRFFGIGVGPGEPGLLPLLAVEVLRQCDVIYAPRAKSAGESTAMRCLQGILPERARIREVEFGMESDRAVAMPRYEELAAEIAAEVESGQIVVYVTLGDPMTYSTYIYALDALRKKVDAARIKTIPGVTSYCAVAAALNFPLGEGKERILILPCPDEMTQLRREIESHDIVVLIKIAERLGAVLTLLEEMQITEHCVLASRCGLPGERLVSDLKELDHEDRKCGYFSTMLIRKIARVDRARGGQI